ncbi:hypothetical protein JKP88DRAFT_272632 [Tribonema minus]|uniref:Uncharacterized protein n=1 Tax=Tribonema minus TaxID=303371 RepID=A0A835ZA43_9STRA|nr:hypothetical protein JKP88DRAFT_272632 [Tribonema minus]
MQIVPGEVTDVELYGGATGSISQCTVIDAEGPFIYSWSDGNGEADRNNLRAGVYVLTVTDQSTEGTAEFSYTVRENGPLTVDTPGTITNSAFRSKTGSIGPAQVSGGSSLYTFAWRDDASLTSSTRSDLAKGTYVLIIDDTIGSTQLLYEYIVEDFEPLSIVKAGFVTQNQVYGGTTASIADSEFGGGNGNYQVTWADDESIDTHGRADLGSGEYTLVLRDTCGSAPVTFTFTVEDPEPITVVKQGIVQPSFGNAIGSVGFAQIQGGNGHYIFRWSDNAAIFTANRTDLEEGEYTMYITDTAEAMECAVDYVVPKYDEIKVFPGATKPTIGLGSSNGIIFASTVTGGSGLFEYIWGDMEDSVEMTFRQGLTYGHYVLNIIDTETGQTVAANFSIKQQKKPDQIRYGRRIPSYSREYVHHID